MLSREVEGLLQRTDLIDTRNLRCRWQNHVGTDECMFDAFDPVIDLSPLCDAWRTILVYSISSALSMANPRICSKTRSF